MAIGARRAPSRATIRPDSMFEPPPLWATGPRVRAAAASIAVVVLLPFVAETMAVVRPAASRSSVRGSTRVAIAPPITVPRPRPSAADSPLAKRLARSPRRVRRGRSPGGTRGGYQRHGKGHGARERNASDAAAWHHPRQWTSPQRDHEPRRVALGPPGAAARSASPPPPHERHAPVRRAAADPVDPVRGPLHRLLQQLRADGQLPRHRARHPPRTAVPAGGDRRLPGAAARRRRARHDDPAERPDPLIERALLRPRRIDGRGRELPGPAVRVRARDGRDGEPGPAPRPAAPVDAAAAGLRLRHRRLDARHRRLRHAVRAADAAGRVVRGPRHPRRPAVRRHGADPLAPALARRPLRDRLDLPDGGRRDLVAVLPDRHLLRPEWPAVRERERHPTPGAPPGERRQGAVLRPAL